MISLLSPWHDYEMNITLLSFKYFQEMVNGKISKGLQYYLILIAYRIHSYG